MTFVASIAPLRRDSASSPKTTTLQAALGLRTKLGKALKLSYTHSLIRVLTLAQSPSELAKLSTLSSTKAWPKLTPNQKYLSSSSKKSFSMQGCPLIPRRRLFCFGLRVRRMTKSKMEMKSYTVFSGTLTSTMSRITLKRAYSKLLSWSRAWKT